MNTDSSLSLTTADLDQLRSFLLDLVATHAYKEGDFTLSSGQKSSYYINGKLVTLRADGALVLGRLMGAMLSPETIAVAGLTLGADPLVSAVSVVSASGEKSVSGIIIRKQAKGHGTKAYLEGPPLAPGAKVVVLEDVVTTGNSAWQAVERLRDAGYEVEKIIAIVDRLQGGAEFYQEKGIPFEALFTIADVQERYQSLNR